MAAAGDLQEFSFASLAARPGDDRIDFGRRTFGDEGNGERQEQVPGQDGELRIPMKIDRFEVTAEPSAV